MKPAIAITSGEPAGIGPELCAMIAARHAREPLPARLVVIGDRGLLSERAARIGLPSCYEGVEIRHVPCAVRPLPGRPDPANATAVVDMLRIAADECANGTFDALVTAPVQKSALLDAGITFTGHTEFFAERTHTPRVVMMLVGGALEAPLRVALVTTHLPLVAVPAAVTEVAVRETVEIVHDALRGQFGIAHPRIAVCGLNPHAGEGGHLGREDADAIAPAVASCRSRGIDAVGPLPADTAFVPQHSKRFDAIVAMYHDQGLPALKAVSFGGGVNVTLGLPFIRTSVDHGTALDLAADADRARSADDGSLRAAVELAIALARERR